MKFLIYMVALTNMISLFHLGAFLIGANVYDIRTLKRKHMRHTTKRKTRAYNPLVSVIVPAHNEENGILRTLDSLRESTYTNMEIIVVDDGSTDKTYQRVRRYAANSTKNPPVTYLGRDPRTGRFHRRSRRHVDNGTPITLLQQANAGKAYAVNNGIKNYAKGKLVMCLDADSQLPLMSG
jgi:biofilm PGA synthesis N-glycosyltransferase PgaC